MQVHSQPFLVDVACVDIGGLQGEVSWPGGGVGQVSLGVSWPVCGGELQELALFHEMFSPLLSSHPVGAKVLW